MVNSEKTNNGAIVIGAWKNGMRKKSQPINESFGKSKHKNVVFFKYTGSIKNE
jgi:hypothetical protein